MTIAALQRYLRVFLFLMGLMTLVVSFTWSVATVLELLFEIKYYLRNLDFASIF